MVAKEIEALKDLTLNTRMETRILSLGEIATVEFDNEREFQNLMALGSFREYGLTKAVDPTRRPAYRGDETGVPAAETEEKDIKQCPECGNEMVPGVDESGGEPKDVILCPKCQFQDGEEAQPEEQPVLEEVDSDTGEVIPEPLVEEPEVPTPKKKKKKTRQSRCPICKKPKKKYDKYCRSCAASMKP